MTKYKFTESGRSYATGQTWAAGQVVPDSMPIGLLETMLKDGLVIAETPKEQAHETVNKDYTNLLSKELTDILEARVLPTYGTKDDKIARLIEDDND